MIILILGIVVVILAVLGVTFLVKGYLKVPDPGEIVPLADLNKVKDDLALKTEEEGRLKLQIDSIVIELEETKMKLEEVERTGGGSEVSKVKEEEYKTRIQALENDLTQIRTKANSLAQESIDVINTLDVKNKELQEKVKAAEQYQEKLQALDQLMEEKQVLVSQLEENAVKINDLESNQERIQNRSEEKVREANALAEGLVVKNKKLNEGLKNITAKIDEVETEFVKVKDGKEKELKEANLMVSQLLDEINSLQTRIDGNDK